MFVDSAALKRANLNEINMRKNKLQASLLSD